jgi:hypothetical protein
MVSGLLKRGAFAAGRHTFLVPWALNSFAFLTSAVTKMPSRYRDGGKDYGTSAGNLGSDPAAAWENDLSVNFFARVILEHGYSFVIELGAYTCDRSWRLAKLFPNCKFYALDVTADFTERREMNGVTLGPNTLDEIKAIAAREGRNGLICSNGTLCYYPEIDLLELFKTTATLGLDLAFNEPNTIGEETLPHQIRRTRISYYQPYLPMLRSLGFSLPGGHGRQVRDCNSTYGEMRTFIFAKNPARA